MTSRLDKLFRPGQRQLVLFGIIISFFLLYGLYVMTLGWGPTFNSQIKVIYGILLFLLLVTFLHDKYNNTYLKRYVLLTIGLFTIYSLVTPTTMTFLKNISETQIIRLGSHIDKYKRETGKYPVDINDKYFSKFSKRTYLGTKISIETRIADDKKDTSCIIHYSSLRGFTACFDVKTKDFYYYD
jgi:hypothetical protein